MRANSNVNPNEPFDRNVYILGAGFSAAAGAPLINNFLDVASSLWEDPDTSLTEDQRNDFGKVFHFRREMAQAREKVRIDLDNVEHLFGLIDIAERLSSTGADARKAILSLISSTLELKTKDPLPAIGFQAHNVVPQHLGRLPAVYARLEHSNPPEYRTDIYSHFASLVTGLLDSVDKRRKCRDTIITFNYDLVVDRALRAVGAEVDYCLPREKLKSATPAVSVIKLHGSTNWATCPACGTLRITEPQDLPVSESECGECHQLMVPLLIPPSWNKASSNTHGTDTLFSLWSAAADALKTATRICVIGYSIPETDAFFRYLLTFALSQNHHLNAFLVIDPAEQVNQKFRALLEPIFLERRYRHFESRLEDALATTDFYSMLRRGDQITYRFSYYGIAPGIL